MNRSKNSGRNVHKDKNNVTILIVDDDPLLLELADAYLLSLGFSTTLAQNPQEALRAFEKNEDIGLLFSDIQMPGCIDGIELASLAQILNPELKVLLTTGNKDQLSPMSDKDTLAGFHIVLPKPYTLEELAHHISCVLNDDNAPKLTSLLAHA